MCYCKYANKFMLYLLLGPDDFFKNDFITSLVKEKRADLVKFVEIDNLPQASDLFGTDLFSKPKVFVFDSVIPKLPEDLSALVKSPNQIVISIKSLDKRKKENKDLLANKNITVQEFSLPHGRELNQWITNRIKLLGGTITSAATESLAVALGRDDAKETKFGGRVVEVEEAYSLWQADAEIKKLLAFANGREINENDVLQLVNQTFEVDVFELTNSIADGKKQQAMKLLHKFLFNQTGSDEKGTVIQLNALLSQQFRNVASTQDFLSRKIGDGQILEITGWKSGKLFVLKKIAKTFSPKKVLEFLNKLVALDEELKSSNVPPKVLLDLIVSQLF